MENIDYEYSGIMNFTNLTTDFESYDYEEADRSLELTISIVASLFLTLIGITGFIGNLLVVITVAFNAQMRNTTNLLILNLSIADLLFICFCIPFTVLDYIYGQWLFGLTLCKTVQYLMIVPAYISIYTLVLLSVDRFLAVCYPASRIRNERNTILSIVILWLAVLFFNLPVFHANELVVFQHGEKDITVCTQNDFYSFSTIIILKIVLSCFLPLIIIVALILSKCILMKSNVRSNEERDVTRLVIIMILCFAILWLPIQTLWILRTFDIYQVTTLFKVMWLTFALGLAYTSSCINPLLYAIYSEKFRKSFKKIVGCGN